MVKSHMKRLVAPKTWAIERKTSKWITRPKAGPHSIDKCMALETVMKELIKCARTRKEVKIILNTKSVFVDCKRRKEPKFPVGLMDVLALPEIKQYYRILLNKKGKIIALPIKKEESNIKLCKIVGKTKIKKDIIQINLFDSRNILFETEPDYKVGDTLVLSLPDQKIKEHIKLEKNVLVYLTGGKYVGNVGRLEGIDKDTAKIKLSDGSLIETSKRNLFAIGKEKPLISIDI